MNAPAVRSCAACSARASTTCGLCGARLCARCTGPHQQGHADAPAAPKPEGWRKGGPPLKLGEPEGGDDGSRFFGGGR